MTVSFQRGSLLTAVALLLALVSGWNVSVQAARAGKKKTAAEAPPRVAAHTVTLEGELAYVGDSAGLLVLDLSDPLRPRQHARLTLADAAQRVVLNGDVAYVALGSHGVATIDIHDRDAPVEIARYDPPGSVRDMILYRDHLILAEAHHGLRVVDVRDPRAPRERTRIPSRTEVRALVRDGERLLTAEGDAGVRLFDLARVDAPRELRRLATLRGARDLAVGDGVLAVALGRGGVKLLAFEDGETGRELATLDERALGILFVGERLYLADGRRRGVTCVDVTDPARPRILSRLRTQRHPSTGHLAAAGDSLFGAGGEGGLFWIDYADPAHPRLLLPRKRPLNIRMP